MSSCWNAVLQAGKRGLALFFLGAFSNFFLKKTNNHVLIDAFQVQYIKSIGKRVVPTFILYNTDAKFIEIDDLLTKKVEGMTRFVLNTNC